MIVIVSRTKRTSWCEHREDTHIFVRVPRTNRTFRCEYREDTHLFVRVPRTRRTFGCEYLEDTHLFVLEFQITHIFSCKYLQRSAPLFASSGVTTLRSCIKNTEQEARGIASKGHTQPFLQECTVCMRDEEMHTKARMRPCLCKAHLCPFNARKAISNNGHEATQVRAGTRHRCHESDADIKQQALQAKASTETCLGWMSGYFLQVLTNDGRKGIRHYR